MPNTACLSGPAFSLTGDLYFSGTTVSFQVTFNEPSDPAAILAYEWYLDHTLIIGQNEIQFDGQISCGSHTIGVRILSAGGWSGIKSLEFATCRIPTNLLLYGVSTIDEGASSTYFVLQLYSDGSSKDITSSYTFSSTEGGSFNGNVFTAATDPSSYDSYQVTISALKDNEEPLTKQVMVNNTTPVVQVSIELAGPDAVDEGTSAGYTVISTYSDGSQRDLTANYTFSCTEGTFSGNILTIPLNQIVGDSRPAIIYASQSGIAVLSKQITINDKDDPIVISDFDFMAVRYHWLTGAGSDLDILVGYENNGTTSDQVYVGFGQPNTTVPANTIPQSDAHLWWGLDNTGQQGYEGVLIGIKKFIAAYPVSPNIVEVGLYAVWFGTPITGVFSIELVTYKGGTMSLVGNNFVNVGGVQVSSNVVDTQTFIRKTSQSPAAYFKVGRLRYNKTTETGTIEIN